jgi:glycosyltransferase involved in cell wall biosynthesis
MPALSLSMIVKNEEKHLSKCLSSVKGVVDEIVVVDTGSSDRTIEIAESFGAKIFHFDWVNDFSAARNFALSKCSGDWILYLDADEELNPDSIEEVNKYKAQNPVGVNCTVKSLGSLSVNESVMKYPRMFANIPGLEFTGKVHEQIIDSLKKNKIPIVDSGIEIIHYGYAIDEESLQQKKERNLSLLLSNENKKNNTYDKLKLIQTLISLDKYDEAEMRVNTFIKSKNISANDLALSLFYMAQIKFEKNDLKSANDFALRSLKKLSSKPELNYLLYLINLRVKNIDAAFKYILICIANNKSLIEKSTKFESENILDHIDLYLRAINLILKLNNKAEADKLVTDLASYISDGKSIGIGTVQPFVENLFLNCIIKESDTNFLKELFKPAHLNSIIEIIILCKDEHRVISILSLLLKIFPESSTIYKNLAQLHVNLDQEKAIEFFNKSLEYDEDPSVYVNLISLHISKSDYQSAALCFSKLQSNCSHIPQIKQKIEILKEKLNPILSSYTT